MYKLLISDMDSTIIQQECIDELADFVGKKDYVAAITEKAMRGELDFPSALRERVALLKGLPEHTLQRCYDDRITLTPGAQDLIAAANAKGLTTVLISGGFTFFTARVAQAAGFKHHHGNELEIENGHLTGRVIEPILGKEAKLSCLHHYCHKLSISPAQVIAMGDGANDLPMLQAAGLSVAYYAKPAVAEACTLSITSGDLSQVIGKL
jgi:phosphoserine phosphatase